jgi:queuine tRNA-ribosyltransferase
MFEYKIIHKSQKSQARLGEINLPHGKVKTPVFMPVGTVGAVKTMTPEDLIEAGSEIILANTYHLYLRPGDKLIGRMGGLNTYIKWDRPILTDSGGYQVFSLGEGIRNLSNSKLQTAKITDKEVVFYSHLDGKKHLMTPEKSIRIQKKLGSDLIMAFDDCPTGLANRERVEQALKRTLSWYKRCEREHCKTEGGGLVPICQGGKFKDLRKASCQFLNKTKAPVLAVGGVSVGEKKKDIYKVAGWCAEILDPKRPRYLMGVGYPEDIAQVVKRGFDMFDCVLPTRLARHGSVWVKSNRRGARKIEGVSYGYEQINLMQGRYTADKTTLDSNCRCRLCQNEFSKSYLRHLLKEREPLGIHLLTAHNLTFIFDLIYDLRSAIKNNSF